MSLHACINAVTNPEDASECRVEFSLWDGDDSATISFIETIGIPHVCYLVESQIEIVQIDMRNAYEQMLNYIYDTDPEKIEIGKQFDTGE